MQNLRLLETAARMVRRHGCLPVDLAGQLMAQGIDVEAFEERYAQ